MGGLKTLLFKPKWQHRRAEIRRHAVTHDDAPALLDCLPDLARNDPDPSVRLAATHRLRDIYHLMRIANGDPDDHVREAAQRHWLHLLIDDNSDLPKQERLDIAAKLDQNEQIQFVLNRATDNAFRLAVLPKITQGALGDLALSDPDPKVRMAAVDLVEQESTLRRVSKVARKKDKTVYRALRAKLDALSDASQRSGETGLRLCQQLEALSRSDVGVNTSAEQRLAEAEGLVESFRRLDPDPALQQRFAGAYHVLVSAAESVVPPPSDAPPTDAPLPKEDTNPVLSRLLERASAAANRKRVSGSDLQRLRRDWQHAWTTAATPSASEERLHDQFEGALGKLTERLNQQTQERTEAIDRIDEQLGQVEVALQAGNLKQSVSAVRRFNESLQLIGKHRKTDGKAFRSRMNAARGQLHELRDWQHWANDKIRHEIIDQAAKLPASGLHPDAVAEKVKGLQAQWKKLDSSERLPGDTSGRIPSPALHRKFRALCNQAYKPAKQFFEKRQEVRHRKLEEFERLLSDLKQMTAASMPDLHDSEQLIRHARGSLRKLDGLPPKQRGAMAKSLRDGANALDHALDDQYQIIERRKRRLIDEVRALAEEPDLDTAISAAKATQARWQEAGRLRRRQDQKLWREYRTAVDAVFDRLGQQREQAKAARNEEVGRLRGILKKVGVLLEQPDDAMATADQQLARLKDQWIEVGANDRRLEAEFQRQCQAVESAARDARRKKQRGRRQQARLELKSLRRLEQRWLTGETIALADMPKPDTLPSSLHPRLSRLNDWIARSVSPVTVAAEMIDNTARLRQLCIAIEFLAGVETPPEDSQQRMDYQVNRLAGRMGGEQTESPRREAAELERQWLVCGPIAASDDHALNARFSSALDALEKTLD